MAKNGPNKTAAKAAQRRAFDPDRQAAKDAARAKRTDADPFMQFMFEQARNGVQFTTMEEAQAAFAKRTA